MHDIMYLLYCIQVPTMLVKTNTPVNITRYPVRRVNQQFESTAIHIGPTVLTLTLIKNEK